MIYAIPVAVVTLFVLLCAGRKSSGPVIWGIISLVIGALWAVIIMAFLPLMITLAMARGALDPAIIDPAAFLMVGLPHLLVMWILLIIAPDQPCPAPNQLQKQD